MTLPTSSVFSGPTARNQTALRIAIEHRCHIDEIDRRIMDDAFAFLHELLDEVAQTKFFGVDLGHQGAFPWDACSMNARDLTGAA